MVGSNCSMYGCSNSRNKTNGLGIFRIPTKDDEYNKNWHNALVQIITKDREVDDQLRDQQKGLYIFVKNTTEKIKSTVVSFSSLILIITIASNYKDFDLQKLSSTFWVTVRLNDQSFSFFHSIDTQYVLLYPLTTMKIYRPLSYCSTYRWNQDTAAHPFEVDKMSTRAFWELSGKK